MRVLLTGATGFIGARVAARLDALGLEIVALARPGAARARLGPRATFIAGDLFAPEALGAALAPLTAAPPEVALHLAWRLESDFLDAADAPRFVSGTLALVRALDALGCARHVFAGSYLEVAAPTCGYAASKRALASEAEALCRARGRGFVWARLPTVYGPGAHAFGLVPTLIARLISGEPCAPAAPGRAIELLHVDDAAAGLVELARGRVTGTVALGSGQRTPIAEVARRLAELVGRPELVTVDAQSAEDQGGGGGAEPPRLGPVGIDLDRGLAETVAWWRAERGRASAGDRVA